MRGSPLISQPAAFLVQTAGASRSVDREAAASELIAVEKRSVDEHRKATTEAEHLKIAARSARDRAKIQRELAHEQIERAVRQRPQR
ncbi:MAG TPA: hypothetical protein VE777_19395 [Gaiellales bacterium]|jgi:hypothetical protein|nr:hypothetical protein [Gaiellales bacterium]